MQLLKSQVLASFGITNQWPMVVYVQATNYLKWLSDISCLEYYWSSDFEGVKFVYMRNGGSSFVNARTFNAPQGDRGHTTDKMDYSPPVPSVAIRLLLKQRLKVLKIIERFVVQAVHNISLLHMSTDLGISSSAVHWITYDTLQAPFHTGLSLKLDLRCSRFTEGN